MFKPDVDACLSVSSVLRIFSMSVCVFVWLVCRSFSHWPQWIITKMQMGADTHIIWSIYVIIELYIHFYGGVCEWKSVFVWCLTLWWHSFVKCWQRWKKTLRQKENERKEAEREINIKKKKKKKSKKMIIMRIKLQRCRHHHTPLLWFQFNSYALCVQNREFPSLVAAAE